MKHKYLEEIGLKYYPDNHFGITSIKEFFRHIGYKVKKRKTGVDPRDCWALDSTFYGWLYEHLCQFKKDAGEIVDLEYEKFQFEEKEYTLIALINYLIDLLKEIIFFEDNYLDKTLNDLSSPDNHFDEYLAKYNALRKKICDIWCLILPCMWW